MESLQTSSKRWLSEVTGRPRSVVVRPEFRRFGVAGLRLGNHCATVASCRQRWRHPAYSKSVAIDLAEATFGGFDSDQEEAWRAEEAWSTSTCKHE